MEKKKNKEQTESNIGHHTNYAINDRIDQRRYNSSLAGNDGTTPLFIAGNGETTPMTTNQNFQFCKCLHQNTPNRNLHRMHPNHAVDPLAAAACGTSHAAPTM